MVFLGGVPPVALWPQALLFSLGGSHALNTHEGSSHENLMGKKREIWFCVFSKRSVLDVDLTATV